MKKTSVILCCILIFSATVWAQSLAVNTTGASAATSSMLDISSTTKGLLIPRMTAAQKTAIGAPATGLIIYQTDGTTGLYQYDGATWQHILNGNEAWSLLGNAGVVSGTNFVGSTNNADVAFRSNNTETFRMTNAQKLLIGVTTPTAPGSQKLEVSSGTGDAVFGHSNNIGGWLGYETNFTAGTGGNILGAGVYTSNAAAGYVASYAASSGAATVAANMNFSNVWHANYNLVDNASATYNPNASYNQLNVTNAGLGGTHIALRGWSERGTLSGNPGYTVGVQGDADAQNQDAIGVQGISYSSSGGISTGGYFEGLTYPGISIAYAYVGGWINGATARKIIGTGSVSEIVPTPNHGRVTLTAPESPEYWYQDYGSVKMINGKAHVQLDPILADIIFVNEENPIRVFCTPVDMPQFNGVCILNKTSTGFDIVEINNGTHSGTIDYQVVVKPKTNYGEGRFPQAPGPSYLKKDKEPALAKAVNDPADGRKIFRWPSDTETYHYKPEEMAVIGEEINAGPYKGMIKIAEGVYEKAGKASKPGIPVKEN